MEELNYVNHIIWFFIR